MMNELKKEWKLIFAVLASVTALSILLAAGFAALYLSGRNTAAVGTDVSDRVETQTDSASYGQQGEPVSADTAALAELRRENEFLEQQANDLRAELDALKNAAEEAANEA